MTPKEELASFQLELAQLQKKYSVAILPYIKTYNSGKQEAAIEFRIVENGDTQKRDRESPAA